MNEYQNSISLPFTIIFILIFSGCAMPEGPVPLSGDVPEAKGWTSETLISGLDQPWSITWLPDSTFLITERSGQLLYFEDYQSGPIQITGLPEIYVDGQGGLMDISIHPAYVENRWVFLTYASGDEDSNRTAVLRAVLNVEEQQLESAEEIFRVTPDKDSNQHFGSRIVWTSSYTFALSVGDGGNRPVKTGDVLSREHAQMLNSHLGKVLHLTQNGEPTETNPFVDDPDALPEIWSYGHRNIQGLAYNNESGNLWANEHGSRGGDELNLIRPGENYGWPEVTYSREYWYTSITSETSKPDMVDPKVVWTPAQAPSGLLFYTGDKFPEWQGDLFSGGLQGEQVRRIILDGESVIGEEKITIGRRVRDVKQGPHGFIYVLTGHDNGELIRILPE
ncbi:PQQ-dependent sugar dehydrogenase [Rhodohalobacter halophilus]|uniref:PQQ-dependent sugar dehydrogenase n=1 Tax=Rhodohalobacter halophilus TaxID=1812810 RepID=UPI00083F6D9E|nr:PQQ-dependent sugar dehydrogenase [Rhodohalobacter halophilus]